MKTLKDAAMHFNHVGKNAAIDSLSCKLPPRALEARIVAILDVLGLVEFVFHGTITNEDDAETILTNIASLPEAFSIGISNATAGEREVHKTVVENLKRLMPGYASKLRHDPATFAKYLVKTYTETAYMHGIYHVELYAEAMSRAAFTYLTKDLDAGER